VSEWRECWTPEEYAEMQELLTPEELQKEIVRIRAKRAELRIALEMGISLEDALLMRLQERIILYKAGEIGGLS
jgi:hypothetical protein